MKLLPKSWLTLFCISILVGGLSPFLSSNLPDGLERVAIDLKFIDREAPIWHGLFPDYSFGDTILGSFLSGVIGVMVTTLLLGVFGFVLLSRRKTKVKS